MIKTDTKSRDRSAEMLDRIRESVSFWRQDKNESPRAVVLSVESYMLIGMSSETRIRHDARSGEMTATARVWGIPIVFDNQLAEGSYRIR